MPDDQDRLSRLEAGAPEHPVRGERGEGEGGTLGPGPLRRLGHDVAGRDREELGVSAPPLLPHDLEPGVHRGIIAMRQRPSRSARPPG